MGGCQSGCGLDLTVALRALRISSGGWVILPAVLDTLSPKTLGALRETRKEKGIVYIDSGENLREYNWRVTTNYLSIYMIVHVVTTRLACDAQPSISQLY